MIKPKKRQIILNLKNQIKNDRANSIYNLSHCYNTLKEFNKEKYKGSGLIVTITDINTPTKNSVEFMVNGGLTDETINLLKKEIKAKIELQLMLCKLMED